MPCFSAIPHSVTSWRGCLSERLEQANVGAIRRLEERNRALQAALDELHAAQAELVEKQKLEHELDLARDIQMSLLPPALPAVKGFDFGARLLPMSQVGGDFYDFIPLTDGNLGIAVGDVSGHGMPAALIMAITLALLRAEACSRLPAQPGAELRQSRTAQAWQPPHVCDRALRRASRRHGRVRIHACRTRASRRSRPPAKPPCLADLAGGRMLGLFEDVVLADSQLTLPPGGSLVLYTDGVIETRSAERDFFGEERLLDLVLQDAGLARPGRVRPRDGRGSSARRGTGATGRHHDRMAKRESGVGGDRPAGHVS